jgi:hypothetical protein
MEFSGKGAFLSVSHEITGIILIQTMMAKNATVVRAGSTVGTGLLANEGPIYIAFAFGDSVVGFMDIGTVGSIITAMAPEIIETAQIEVFHLVPDLSFGVCPISCECDRLLVYAIMVSVPWDGVLGLRHGLLLSPGKLSVAMPHVHLGGITVWDIAIRRLSQL